jgi:TolB protein
MNLDGSGLENLTDDPGFDSAPSTLPGVAGLAERIAFVSDRAGGNLDVYTMNVDGSDLYRVTTESGDDFDTSWTSDGMQLVFDSNRNGNWDIFTIEPSGANTIGLTIDASDDESPAWRPN